MEGDEILYEKLVEGGSIKAIKRPKNGAGSAWTYVLISDERDLFDDERTTEELYREETYPSEEALVEAYMKRTRG